MRRPSFYRWIRIQVLSIAQTRSFSLRRLTAKALATRNDELLAALLLYSHENGCVERFLSFVYDDDAKQELIAVENKFGSRSIERLALRGTPMRSLPDLYCDFLIAFEQAYHTPERVAAEKRTLLEQAREIVLKSGTSPAEIARTLGIDRANLNAYLTRGETHRINLETARKLANYAA